MLNLLMSSIVTLSRLLCESRLTHVPACANMFGPGDRFIIVYHSSRD